MYAVGGDLGTWSGDELVQDLRTADMNIYDHDFPELKVEHLESTLTKLCSDHRRRRVVLPQGRARAGGFWNWSVKDRECVHREGCISVCLTLFRGETGGSF